jgi:hypothetical protein
VSPEYDGPVLASPQQPRIAIKAQGVGDLVISVTENAASCKEGGNSGVVGRRGHDVEG